jgi:parvulin-like peptidyl-prolyl isomerase
MQSLQRVLFVVLLLAALSAAACSGQPLTGASDQANSVAAISNPAPADAIQVQSADPAAGTPIPTVALITEPLNAAGEALVARVNGTEITKSTLDRAMARYEQQQLLAQDAGALRDMILNTLVDQALIDQAALNQSVLVTDADVQTELDANKQIAGSNDAWNTWLSANLYTEDEFRATLRDTLITARMRDIITQDVNGVVPYVHARHILVSTETEANDLIARVRAGEDFTALAAQYSKDITTKDQGGDLGWFAQGELLEPYLSEVAFSIQPGDIAGPIATTLGYHVLQTLEREDRPVPEDKRASLAQSQFEQWLEGLRTQATIEIF